MPSLWLGDDGCLRYICSSVLPAACGGLGTGGLR